MDCDLHSEQPNVGSLRSYRSQSDLAYSYNRAMGIAMIAHRRPCLVGHVIRPTKRCGNRVTARRLLINSVQKFHHTSRWNLSIRNNLACDVLWPAYLPLEAHNPNSKKW